MDEAIRRIDLPLCRVELDERGALRRGPITVKLKLIARVRAIAKKVRDRIAVGLTSDKLEDVVAGSSSQRVNAYPAIQRIVASGTVEGVISRTPIESVVRAVAGKCPCYPE